MGADRWRLDQPTGPDLKQGAALFERGLQPLHQLELSGVAARGKLIGDASQGELIAAVIVGLLYIQGMFDTGKVGPGTEVAAPTTASNQASR